VTVSRTLVGGNAVFYHCTQSPQTSLRQVGPSSHYTITMIDERSALHAVSFAGSPMEAHAPPRAGMNSLFTPERREAPPLAALAAPRCQPLLLHRRRTSTPYLSK